MADHIKTDREPYEVTDRRPMKLRDMGVFQWMSKLLVKARVSPQVISLSGIGFSFIAGFAFFATSWIDGGIGQRVLWIVGGAAVQFRGLANLLDGMVAVESGQASAVGELQNEVPDRISDVLMLIGLGYAVGSSAELGYVGAVVTVFVAYVRAMGCVAGGKQEYCGPMAKPQRNTLVTAAAVWIGLTPASWTLEWWGPGRLWGTAAMVLLLIIAGGLVTAWRRLSRVAKTLRGS